MKNNDYELASYILLASEYLSLSNQKDFLDGNWTEERAEHHADMIDGLIEAAIRLKALSPESIPDDLFNNIDGSSLLDQNR